LLYVFAILATAIRLGRYLAMIINYVEGNQVHTELQMMVDLGVSSLLVVVGLCLTIIMLKLYTYLQCWSIFLHSRVPERRGAHHNQLHEVRKLQHEQF